MKLFERVLGIFRRKNDAKTNGEELAFENTNFIQEENIIAQPTYDIKGDRDLLIMNISKFESENLPSKFDRLGSEVDVHALKFSFEARNFELVEKPLNGWVSYRDLQNLLDAYLKSEGRPKLFAIAIMSHGTENDKIQFSNGETKSVYKMLEPIFTRDKLSGVPKLVICQSCRGESLIPTAMVADSAKDDQTTINGQADTLFYFATAIGNLAVRDTKDGSPFIKVFCDTFRKENNFFNMSIAINRKIAEKDFPVEIDGDVIKYKQIPVFCHSFTKSLEFENFDPSKSKKGK